MQPTFRGRLKRACHQISYLETPTREAGLKTPYLICDYYGGSHEADECKQLSQAKQTDNFTERETEKEGLKGAEPNITQEPAPRPSILYPPSKTSNLPFPSRLKKQKKNDEDERLLSIFKQIHINLPFLEAMIHMPKGAKVLKDLLSHKEKLEKAASSVKLSEECSAIIQRSLPQKEGDPGSFTLLCLIGPLAVKNALANLRASINLMPHSVFRRLGISKLKPTKISIQLADRSIKYPIGVCENLLVKEQWVDTVNHNGKWTEEEEEEDSNKSLAVSFYLRTKPVEPLEWKALDNRLKPSSVEPPKLELRELPEHLEYAFLQENNQLPVVISSALSTDKKTRLLEVLQNHKGAIAWSIADIKGIDSSFCTHKILMEDEFKPSVQPQRRVNPNIKEVVKEEVIKLLDTGLIYPIFDSPWVTHVQVVPNKGGMTVVNNKKDELIPQRTVTRWRMCVDYRKLNNATRKDHFPLPFTDQMLERLVGHEYYCFLDGFSGYFQIPIAPKDQKKTTFTCPYGTFAYKRMPFGLCNAPATFQRCITAIFHELI
ncbi:reverse transcriptase domain-containing protein, partial [Tanacetum coccineum]